MTVLEDVIASVTYKRRWHVALRIMHDQAHIWITAEVPDSNHPHEMVTIDHILPVPPDLFDLGYIGPKKQGLEIEREIARRWVYDQILAVERHETGEWLRFDDERPFLPYHGEEGDPYAEPERITR